MTEEMIRFDRRGRIGVLTLNRPARLNAVTLEMMDELRDLFAGLQNDLETRVVVVRGEGRAFCAGTDLRVLAGMSVGDDESGAVQRQYKMQQAAGGLIMNMRRAPQPLIAAVRGPAAGAGFSIALACDMRIAGESARFNAAFIRVGLSAGDMGSSYHLPRLIGMSRAAEYLYTGRFIDATTADRIGLVSQVVPDDRVEDVAMELAEEMLEISPFGLRVSKELLNMNVDAPSLESAIHLENRTQVLCIQTEDAAEGPRAFLEKRPPVWRDR